MLGYLTGIHATIRVAGADKILVYGLEVRTIAVFVTPNRQFSLALRGRFLATIVGGTPTNYRRTSTRQTLFGRRPPGAR